MVDCKSISLFAETADDEITYYTYGLKDIFTTIFYLLICIVVHAVIQEYILDVRLDKFERFNSLLQVLKFAHQAKLHSEVQCITGNGQMETSPPPLPWPVNITFLHLRCRAVMIGFSH